MKSFGYLIRTLTCFLLLFATWNPTGYSYVAWLGMEDGSRLSVKIAVGVLLLALYAAYLRIAWVALRLSGVLTALTILYSGYLSLRHLGLLPGDAPLWSSYLSLVLAGLVMAAGVCWSHFKRRISGQSHVLTPPP
ncbi:hypothetical protein AZL_b00430 (plasmid) [Azospirillum sp. B510]|uniref:DUF6524 family protein n=1 Tax=Azospirillum sp. (strain B510) TaxID=137722 RepID=UPI0001C4C9B8|nr:DUF6524 family protein [Azospirillum sp. B510]BAI74706.1 hypothetical protein AZL_b00430 [Azospirillum sp. B510]